MTINFNAMFVINYYDGWACFSHASFSILGLFLAESILASLDTFSM